MWGDQDRARRNDDIIAGRGFGVLEHVDRFNGASAREIFLANVTKISDRLTGIGPIAHDEKAEEVVAAGAFPRRRLEWHGDGAWLTFHRRSGQSDVREAQAVADYRGIRCPGR